MRNVVVAIGVVLILVCFVLFGCSSINKVDADTNLMFAQIGYGGTGVAIVYDIETGVMYTKSTSGYNCGSMTVMVNPDGTPRVWEGFTNP